MATNTQTETKFGTGEINWLWAAVAGMLATVAFGGVMIANGGGGVIKGAIPALYGLGPSLVAGWVIHIVHGAVLGLVYAAVVSVGPIRTYADKIGGGLALGAVYGVVTTVALAWLLMPVWLSAVGFPKAPPLPNVQMSSLIGHVVFGVVLGAIYPALSKLR